MKERFNERGLARARTTRNYRNPVFQRGGDGFALRFDQSDAVPRRERL